MVSVSESFSLLAADLQRAAQADIESLTAREFLLLRASITTMRRYLDVLDHRVVGVGARKDLHQSAGASSMNALIASSTGVSRRDAAKTIKLAQHLENAPVLAKQMSKPGMSPAKAHLITEAVGKLPEDFTAQQKQHIENELAEAAPSMSLEQFTRKTRRAIEIVDRTRADDVENNELEQNEAAAIPKASFWMTRPDKTGMVKGGFEIDALTADMLRSMLESKTAPRYRAIQQRNGHAPEQSPALGHKHRYENKQITRVITNSGSPQPIRAINFKETQGAAFIEILRHLPRDAYGNHGGVAATLMVTISEASLSGRSLAAGVTEHGTSVSAGQLRQLACNAGILPALLGTNSQILDLGREQRLHTPAQRKALAHRDDGCAFPGCDRPPGWCETHHVKSWASGGKTSVDNGVLLCGYHHRHVHNSDWRIELNRRDKRPDFYPPGATEPTRNVRYRPLVA